MSNKDKKNLFLVIVVAAVLAMGMSLAIASCDVEEESSCNGCMNRSTGEQLSCPSDETCYNYNCSDPGNLDCGWMCAKDKEDCE